MDKKTYTIGILAITAALLVLANVLVQPSPTSADVIKDRDYQMITAQSQQGGDLLYVVDNRSGQVAIFQWDPGRKTIVLKDAGLVESVFSRR